MLLSKRLIVLLLISTLTYGTAAMALIYYLPRYLLDLGFNLPIIQLYTYLYNKNLQVVYVMFIYFIKVVQLFLFSSGFPFNC